MALSGEKVPLFQESLAKDLRLRQGKTMALSGEKVIYDPIHGHIKLHPLLVKIIDTPEFQRLRNIKQLGGGYFVFPGASHNRFEHSIGVAYLAGKLVRSLRTNPELGITDTDELCVEIAGLCHDLGHGPFSHVFESFMKEVKPHSEWKHEEQSVRMFDHLIKKNGINVVMRNDYNFEDDDFQFIRELIYGPNLHDSTGKTPGHPKGLYKGRPNDKSFLYQIVANHTTGIDVDKMDYLRRDCHQLGIACNFSPERYILFARVCTDETNKKQICVRDKEAMNMYELFHIRNLLYHKFYHHRVTKAVEHMIVDALTAADESLGISAAVNDPSQFVKLTDFILQQILDSPDPALSTAKEILERISTRDLYKFIDSKIFEQKCWNYFDSAEKRKAQLRSWVEGVKNETGSQLDFNEEDFTLMPIKINYGKNNENPIDSLRFYNKNDPQTAIKPSIIEDPYIPPSIIIIIIIIIYKRHDNDVVDLMKANIEKLWEM